MSASLSAQYRLFCADFCSNSRAMRFALYEKCIPYLQIVENPWKLSSRAVFHNEEQTLPSLHTSENVVVGVDAIMHFLDTQHFKPSLFPSDNAVQQHANARKILHYVFHRVYYDVTLPFLYEKHIKARMRMGSPNSTILYAAQKNLYAHLMHFNEYAQRHDFLISDQLSWADIALSTTLSCIEYFHPIAWRHVPNLHIWYMKIKSRPSFAHFLKERVPGISPTKNYSQLDFD